MPTNNTRALQMKKPKKKYRNAAAIPAKQRKAGPIKNKKDKRKKSKKALIDKELSNS
jgi:hypothetical protein